MVIMRFDTRVVGRLVIVDELDYMITKDRAVLHDLFMLTTLPFSKFILIGMLFRMCLNLICFNLYNFFILHFLLQVWQMQLT